VSLRRLGRISSVATMSSPMRRTWVQGATGVSRVALPASSKTTCSIMATASKPGGRGWPVLTMAKPSPGARVAGLPSRAAKVVSPRRAMPSMAAQWKVGELRRATTGLAVTRPRAWSVGTFSTPTRAARSKSALARARASGMETVCK